MKELRCIVFSDRELVGAVFDRRKKLREPIPEGDVTKVRFDLDNGINTIVEIDGGPTEVPLDEEEVQAALVAHCMARGIPLPADSEKTLYVIRGHATLMITMNFRKPARMVALTTAAPGGS